MSDVGFINGLLQTQEADPATPWTEDAFGYLRPVTGNGDNGLKIGSEVQFATASGDDSTGDAENPTLNVEYDTDHWQNVLIDSSDIVAGSTIEDSSSVTNPDYMLDGIVSVAQSAIFNGAGSYAVIDLGSDQAFSKVVLDNSYGTGAEWTIYTATAAAPTSFSTFATLSDLSGLIPVKTFEATEVTARYIKVEMSGGTGGRYIKEAYAYSQAYATASNTVDFDMQFSGTVSFSPASLIVKNSSDAAITTGNLNVAYNHNGAGFTSLIDIDAFKALSKTLFNGTTSLKIQVQPVGATDVKSLTIQSHGTEMKVEAGTPDVILLQDGVETARLATKADINDMRTNAVATVTTTDATVTDLTVIEVAEGETYSVEIDVIAEETGTNRALYKMSGLFYRNASGDVTQQGSTAVLNEIESEPLWACDFAADTANQTIDVRVTGEAATTIDWKVHVQYHKL